MRLEEFWKKQPALHAGLSLLIGSSLSLYGWRWEALIPALLLLPSRRWIVQALLLVGAALALARWHYPTPHFTEKSIEGVGLLHIEALKVQPSAFGRSLQYRGKLTTFETQEGISYNLPCTLYLSPKKGRPLADRDYQIQGTLKESGPRRYLFKPGRKSSWKAVEGTWSLAEWRFQLKQKLRYFLKRKIRSSKSATLLAALATGDHDQYTLTLQFSRLGLQHTLAISGFHFALIAAFLSFFLRRFLSPRKAAVLLMLLLTTYFLFIGGGPSVTRAWIAIALFLIARIAMLRISPLNALGAALSVEILCDPYLVTQVGFQLSFLATLALLLLYPEVSRYVEYLLPRYPLGRVIAMRALDQHLYLIQAGLRSALSLTLSVHLATTPLLLFLFHKFPLLSLGYNLFFPLALSLSLLFLLVALTSAPLLPPLSDLLLSLNGKYTDLLLRLIEQPPAPLDFVLRTPPFSLFLLVAPLTLLFYGGIRAHSLTPYA